VRLRGADKEFGAEAFHQLLCLARLVGLSMGQAQLGRDAWQRACELEAARTQRLPAPPAGAIISANAAA
jgi:hypothetical protein